MTIFSLFTLLGGLAFFLYGMNQMSSSLEKIAGERIEEIIHRMTKNKLAGLLMGCVITIALQSSSAVTVMLVGLVNSGLMNFANTVSVIMGSNIGTTITAWIMSLIGLSGDNLFLRMMKPESFSPLLAFIGIGLMMLSKTQKKKDVGNTFVGFAVLMYGMMLMSGSVAPLADSPAFASLLTAFNNPVLGILTGFVVTAVIQSSAASMGMLQALSLSSGITYGMAIPIIMGQNIGTCVTAVLSSIGVGSNAKKVSVIHLSFNLIGTAAFTLLFYALHFVFDFTFVAWRIDPAGIALCHSVFNIATTVMLLPCAGKLVALAEAVVKNEPETNAAFLDERLFETPSLAVNECNNLSVEMANMARTSVEQAIVNLHGYSDETSIAIGKLEKKVDQYEDRLGSYLVRLSQSALSVSDNRKTAKILHSIGNFERISDHAINLVFAAKEISEKNVEMSEAAAQELHVLESAVSEILRLTTEAYAKTDIALAEKVEPLEQVIDLLTDRIRLRHIDRLQAGVCTIERGFVFADILSNYERISDHCSNIAVAVLEADADVFDPHEYLRQIKTMDNPRFRELYTAYKEQYPLA